MKIAEEKTKETTKLVKDLLMESKLISSDSPDSKIIKWANARTNWEKFIWEKCLLQGYLTEDELNTAYKYFNVEFGLSTEKVDEIKLDGVLPPTGTLLGRVYLKELRNCKNVNAIPEDQALQFNKNLTIGFGVNGSGKSGYGRIMANACYSKGSRTIHSNLKLSSTSTNPPQCEFVIDDGSDNGQLIEYADAGQSHPILKRFYVFDSHSVPIKLDTSNTIQFIPGQLAVFDKVNEYLHIIEMKLEEEKESLHKENPVQNSFGLKESIVSQGLLGINSETEDNHIKELVEFPVNGDKLISELTEKRNSLAALNVPKKKASLATEKRSLEGYKQELTEFAKNFSNENVIRINHLIDEVKEKTELVKKLGSERFNDRIFQTTGSEKWKSMLLAAKELYDAEQTSSNGKKIENCLLCHQALTQKEKSLFLDYWEFLGSTAESELKRAQKNIASQRQLLETLKHKLPKTDDQNFAIKILLENNSGFVTDLTDKLSQIEVVLNQWIEALSSEKHVSNLNLPAFNYVPLNTLIESKEIEHDNLKDPIGEIKELDKRITELEHRKIASSLKRKILEYAAYVQWYEIAKSAKIPKRAYTEARKEFFNQIVTEEYAQIFNKETKALNGDVGLVVESRGAGGETMIALRLEFSRNTKPTDVLSEGEQKACALADFLSEVQLDKNNCGIIFDDPVTSLDHIRKDKIAQRLVEESKKRQVIVLTHDITFLLSLQYYAERVGVDPLTTTIRKIDGTPGFSNPDLPWVAQNVSKRRGVLRTKLEHIGATIRAGASSEEVEEKVKIWYELLREAWERAIEERLLKGIVERFRNSVESNRLKRLEITEEMIHEVVDAMTESSKWLHDRGAGLNIPIPDKPEMENHLKRFEEFIDKCKA